MYDLHLIFFESGASCFIVDERPTDMAVYI